MTSQAEIRAQLPEHLRQFVAEQDYATRYSSQDQAVWRFVMRQLTHQLTASAHPVYFEGLKKTGICLDHIPSIDEMNLALDKLGWRAIVVDGFIPPQAFMELQAERVLAIALDMRSINHIEYTPAPDIIHEAAGHAPIIADEEYSDYLQRFGEVGMKAIYNQYDLNLYNAVRTLSIVKEAGTARDIELAQQALNALVANPGEPSELALLTRLHWWTVEYGLVGNCKAYSLFGAGLLSSLSESLSCLSDDVQKRPLTIEAITQPYDITNTQPQLFVTKSCRHLSQILDEYASTMCYQTGGAQSIKTAIEAGVVTTCEYTSGLQVSGKFTRLWTNSIGTETYLGTEGPTQLSLAYEQLQNHGIKNHRSGFGSPVGRLCNLMKPLEDASEYDLQSLEIRREQNTVLEFLSGVTVSGYLTSIIKDHHKLLLFSFTDCTVTGPRGERLFEPDWGTYDMAVGERISSVFAGSADHKHFDVYPTKTADETKPAQPRTDPGLLALYDRLNQAKCQQPPRQQVRDIHCLAEEALANYPDAWLLFLEIMETLPPTNPMFTNLLSHLKTCAWPTQIQPLITRGLRLLPATQVQDTQ